MSACRIGTIFTGLLIVAIALNSAGASDVKSEKIISTFAVEGVSGKVESKDLFVRKRIVFVVIGTSCAGIEPFLVWQKQLSTQKTDQGLVLCMGGDQQKERNGTVFIASSEAMKALGVTGTPMLLGIEDNIVKWRIAGLIPQWQVFAESWLEAQ